ncbi:PIN domain-containing protein [Rhodobacteraceae bacterium nBUS_24]
MFFDDENNIQKMLWGSMINLFLDTNVFLDFYERSSADINLLSKLKSEIDNKNIKLFTNVQLRDEIQRNRDETINKHFKDFAKIEFKYEMPAFVKNEEGYKDFSKKKTELNKTHSELVNSLKRKIENNELDADLLIKELILENSPLAEITKEHYDAALKRNRRGNPPGKSSNRIGDELYWELLLDTAPNGEDLHIVSGDGDFSSIDFKSLNPFLKKEWQESKGSEIYFYRDLNSFFVQNDVKIKLQEETKLDDLISQLLQSGSYARTHSIIADFPPNSEFSDRQIINLNNAFVSNSQVRDILNDDDVKEIFNIVKARLEEMNT